MSENDSEPQVSHGLLTGLVLEIVQSPLNLALVVLIGVLVYKIFSNRRAEPTYVEPEPELPKLKKKDYTVEELSNFTGAGEEKRVLVAVNGNVYDVTKGKRFYGPGGPYAAFGGRDASRGLATFSVSTKPAGEYDDLSDLNPSEMASVREWEDQFKEKYDCVGRLLKPGEQPTNYSDEEDEPPTPNASTTSATAGSGDKAKDD